MKTVTSFKTLMQLASALGKAKKAGNKKQIKEAQIAHDNYKQLCLLSDEIQMHCKCIDL